MEINDTLKFRSYGWKKDMEQKAPHIQRLYAQDKQYYPKDQGGIVDEWDALIKQQVETERRHNDQLMQ